MPYGGDDPDGYALTVNITRRHLSKGQQAMVMARFLLVSNNGIPKLSPRRAQAQPNPGQPPNERDRPMKNLVTRRRAGVAGVLAAVAIPLALLTGCPAPCHQVCHTGRGHVDPCVCVK